MNLLANAVKYSPRGIDISVRLTIEHEAWNETGQPRVVLFVDFVKPLRFPANLLNWLLMNLAVFTPFIREGMENHNAWEKRFYAEADALRNPPKPPVPTRG